MQAYRPRLDTEVESPRPNYWLCASVSLVLAAVSATARAQYTYEEIAAGLSMRDSLIQDVALAFEQTYSYSDGRTQTNFKDFRYAMQGDKLYERIERRTEDGKLIDENAYDGQVATLLQHYTRSASRQYDFATEYSPGDFYRLPTPVMDQTCPIGEWFSQRQGRVTGTARVGPHVAYILDDGGKDKGVGLGYVVWVVPEMGFMPVRIETYSNGFFRTLAELHEIEPYGKDSRLFVAGGFTRWTLYTGENQRVFDPASPKGRWIRIDGKIKSFDYNLKPDQSLFKPPIPNGYNVSDEVLGLHYVTGDPIADGALNQIIADLEHAFGRADDAQGAASARLPATTPSAHEQASAGKDAASGLLGQPLQRRSAWVLAGSGAAIVAAGSCGILTFLAIRRKRRCQC